MGQPAGSWLNDFRMPGLSQGNISAMVADENYVYILDNTWAGEFGGDTQLKKFVRFDGENYEQLGGFFKCTSCGRGYQTSMIMDSQGNIYIAGFFEGAFNEDGSYVESPNLIRWNTSQNEWEALSNGINSWRINTLEIIGDSLYIGGKQIYQVTQPDLTTLDVSLVASMHLSTGEWSAMDGGVFQEFKIEAIVYDIEADGDGNLFVGGNINQAGSDSISFFSVIKWDPENGSWVPTGGLPYFPWDGADAQSSTVHSLEYDAENNLIYAGGYFGRNTGPRGFAVHDGTSWSVIGGVGQPLSGVFRVEDIYKDPQENRVYVGGTFNYEDARDGNTIGNGIGIYNPATSSWEANPFNGGVTGNAAAVKAFQRFNDEIYFGGTFSSAGTFNANNLARWDGTKCDVLGNGILSDHSNINDLVTWNNKVIAGGSFSRFSTDSAYSLAIYDPATDEWSKLGGGIKNAYGGQGEVNDLHLDGDLLHVAGDFNVAGGINTNDIATYDLSSETWITYGDGIESTNGARLHTVTVFEGNLLIGGNFSAIDGQPADYLAIYDGSSWSELGDVDYPVLSLFVDDTVLYVGGQFSSINGNTKIRKIGAYSDGSFHPLARGLDNIVLSINKDPRSGAILIGGQFGRAYDKDNNPLTVDALVAWNDSTWLPFAGIMDGYRRVEEIFVSEDDAILITGRFETLNGEIFNNLAFFDGCEFHPFDEGTTGEDDIVKSVTMLGDTLFVGGSFTNAGGYPSFGFGAYALSALPFNTECIPEIDFDATYYSCETQVDTLALPEELYAYEWSTGSDSASAVFNSSGIYNVTVHSELGYVTKDTFTFVYEQPMDFSLGNDTTLVGGFSVAAPNNTFYTYEWNTGDTLNSINVYTSGEYGLNLITRGGCLSSDSVVVNITALPGYAGGPGSGFTDHYEESSSALHAYNGGTGHGFHSLFSLNNTSSSFYQGGAGDGSERYLIQTDGNLLAYQGGQNDGYGQMSLTNPLSLSIFSGGPKDGNHQSSLLSSGSLEIYEGSSGQGYQSLISGALKSLTIYAGGQADGYAATFYLAQEVLRAVEKENKTNLAKVYPNPLTQNKLTIELPQFYQQGEVSFFNLQGQKVFKQNFSNGDKITIHLTRTSLKRGLYIILIQAGNDQYESKVIYHY